ncbi:TetR/AcrR family transcriptional regulator [Geodermatophilus sp. URMC 63]
MSPAAASRPARERLLDTAGELFYESGIAATGVDAVLARAHVSPATMYAHFSGKDALVAAYLERRFRRWQQTWDDVLAEPAGPVDRLLSVFDAVSRFRAVQQNRRGCAFLAAATELPPDHPGHRWLVADSRLLADRLHQLAEAAGAADPTDVADGLLGLYDGALARLARQATTPGLDTGDPVQRAREMAADWLVRRVARPAASG